MAPEASNTVEKSSDARSYIHIYEFQAKIKYTLKFLKQNKRRTTREGSTHRIESRNGRTYRWCTATANTDKRICLIDKLTTDNS